MLVLFSLIRPRDLVQRHPTRALRHVENRFPNVPALHVVLQLPAGIPIELVSAPGASGQTSKGKSCAAVQPTSASNLSALHGFVESYKFIV